MPSKMKIEGMTVADYALILQDGGKELERTCPNCGKRKPISKFGLRVMTGKKEIRLQGDCANCRNEE